MWICLICGHVGCGRYVAGHAFHHFTLTQHCYSMQLGNNRVWDYAGVTTEDMKLRSVGILRIFQDSRDAHFESPHYLGDNYVHRLVQNKSDGKLIEVDESGNVVQEGEMRFLSI